MAEAYIVDAVRTPVGKRGGGLAGIHPADLGAHVLRGLVDRTGVDPAAVTSAKKIAKLKPLSEGGRLTAAVSSGTANVTIVERLER